MTTVNQPTAMPTRKLGSAAITYAIMEVAGLVVRNLAPSWYDETVWQALTPLVAFAVGYVVKDRANV